MGNAKSVGPVPSATTPPARTAATVAKRFTFLSPKMGAIYPLLGIMTIAFGLAGVTMGRSLTVSPEVLLDKHKRKNLPDIEQPEQMLLQSQQFVMTSPFRKLAQEHKKGIFFSDIVKRPLNPTFPREANHYKSPKPMKATGSL